MKIHRFVVIGLAACASPAAWASFVGFDMRFEAERTTNAHAVGGALNGAHVFVLYARFTAAVNVTRVFDANFSAKAGSLYQDAFGRDVAPKFGILFPDLSPQTYYDSFVTIKELSVGADDYSVQTEPGFAWLPNGVAGGSAWVNTNPANNLGLAEFNAETGMYETIVAQMTFVGAANTPGWTGLASIEWLDGQGGSHSALGAAVPAPGAAALLALAGVGAARRRR